MWVGSGKIYVSGMGWGGCIRIYNRCYIGWRRHVGRADEGRRMGPAQVWGNTQGGDMD